MSLTWEEQKAIREKNREKAAEARQKTANRAKREKVRAGGWLLQNKALSALLDEFGDERVLRWAIAGREAEGKRQRPVAEIAEAAD
jgi:hypothetical protein